MHKGVRIVGEGWLPGVGLLIRRRLAIALLCGVTLPIGLLCGVTLRVRKLSGVILRVRRLSVGRGALTIRLRRLDGVGRRDGRDVLVVHSSPSECGDAGEKVDVMEMPGCVPAVIARKKSETNCSHSSKQSICAKSAALAQVSGRNPTTSYPVGGSPTCVGAIQPVSGSLSGKRMLSQGEESWRS